MPASGEAITAKNAKDLVQYAQWGIGSITQVQFTPDNKFYVIAAYSGLYLYSAENLEPIAQLSKKPVSEMAIFNNGQSIATLYQRSIEVWDIASQKRTATIPIDEKIWATPKLITSPGSQNLVVITNDKLIILDTKLKEIMPEKANQLCKQPGSGAVSSDGSRLALFACPANILIDLTTMEVVKSLPNPNDYLFKVAFSPDNQWVYYLNNNNLVAINVVTDKVNYITAKNIRTGNLNEHIINFDFTLDGKYLWTRYQCRIHFRNLDPQAESQEFDVHFPNACEHQYEEFSSFVRVSPVDNKILIVGPIMEYRSVNEGSILKQAPNDFSPVYFSHLYTDNIAWVNQSVLLGEYDRVKKLDPSTGLETSAIEIPNFRYFKVFQGGEKLYVEQMNRACIYQFSNGEPENCVENTFFNPIFSIDGTRLIGAGSDAYYVFDATTLESSVKLPYDPAGAIPDGIISPDNQYLFLLEGYKGIKTIDANSGQIYRRIEGLVESISPLSRDNTKFLYVRVTQFPNKPAEREVHECQVSSSGFKCAKKMSLETRWPGWPSTYAYSNDLGLLLIAWNDDAKNEIEIWDVNTQTKVKTMTGMSGMVYALGFSPDNLFLYGAANDGIKIWGIRP